jgi:hypothetical protein
MAHYLAPLPSRQFHQLNWARRHSNAPKLSAIDNRLHLLQSLKAAKGLWNTVPFGTMMREPPARTETAKLDSSQASSRGLLGCGDEKGSKRTSRPRVLGLTPSRSHWPQSFNLPSRKSISLRASAPMNNGDWSCSSDLSPSTEAWFPLPESQVCPTPFES